VGKSKCRLINLERLLNFGCYPAFAVYKLTRKLYIQKYFAKSLYLVTILAVLSKKYILYQTIIIEETNIFPNLT